jgi:hypothetical protein
MNDPFLQLEEATKQLGDSLEQFYWQDKAILFGVIILAFCIGALIAKWFFRVNAIVRNLEEISKKIDDLPKKPIEWADIMPPKPKPTDAERYGPKF